jgi:hypothetical protein
LNRNANEKSSGSEIGLWNEAIRVNTIAIKHRRPGAAKKKAGRTEKKPGEGWR